MKAPLSALLCCTLSIACGSAASPPPQATATEPRTVATVPSVAPAEPKPAEESDAPKIPPRAADAAKWVKDLATEDPSQQGVAAISGLSEKQFGLPVDLRQAMAASVSATVDPTQAEIIIAAALRDVTPEVIEELCGAPAKAFLQRLQKSAVGRRGLLAVQQCDLGSWIDPEAISADSYAFPLLSAVVQKLFQTEGGHSAAEFELARMIATASRVVPDPG